MLRPARSTVADRPAGVWRTGTALFVAQAAAGGLGALAWLVAAKTHSDRSVGTAIALVGAMTWAGLLGNLGLGSTVVSRALDRSRRERAAFAAAAVRVALAAAAAMALVLGLALRLGHGALGATAAQPAVLTSLVFGGAAWAAGVVLDHVAVADGRPSVAVERSLVGGGLRLLVLGGCLATGDRNAPALVAGWALAMVAGSAVAWVRLRVCGALRPASGTGPGPVALARLGARTHHLVNLFGQTPPMVIPVAVAARAGGEAAAAFGAAWQTVGTVGMLSPAVATGLFATGGTDVSRIGERARATTRQVVLVIGAASLVLVIVGPALLGGIGAEYRATGLPALRLLAVALVADAVTNVEIARLRVIGSFGRAVALNGLMAGVAVAGAFVLAGPHGATGAAVAWLAGQSLGALVTRRPARSADPGLPDAVATAA